ncbi:MAG: hypothetical protein AAF798_22620 [Bacteroidota bacterium]
MVQHPVFDELASLLASMDPEKVIAFSTSPSSQDRLEELLDKNKTEEGLSAEENKEMEQFMLLEHIVSLAKAKALKNLTAKA